MAIAFDAQTTANQWGSTPVSSKTWAHTCTGTDLILVVTYATNQDQNVSGITYNGVSLTNLNSMAPGGNNKQSTWYLINPATGSNNIVVSFSSSLAYYQLCAVSFTGVKQTTPFGTPVTAFSNSSVTDHDSAALTTTVANSWALDTYVYGSDGGSIIADSSQTLRASSRNGITGQIYTKLVASPGSTQMDTSVSGTTNNFSHSTVEMFEASASPSGPANVKTVNGLAKASVKTVNGLAMASIKTINGLN